VNGIGSGELPVKECELVPGNDKKVYEMKIRWVAEGIGWCGVKSQ